MQTLLLSPMERVWKDRVQAEGPGDMGGGKAILVGLEIEVALHVAGEGGELGDLSLMGHQEGWGPPSPGQKRDRDGNLLGLEERPGKQIGDGEDKKGRHLQHSDSSCKLLSEYLLGALVRDCRHDVRVTTFGMRIQTHS